MRSLVCFFVALIISTASLADSTKIRPIKIAHAITPVRLDYKLETTNVNSNQMNMGPNGWPQTLYGGQQVFSLSDSEAQMQLNNGHNFIIVPTTGKYSPYMDVMTINDNGGSGEWNVIVGRMYADTVNSGSTPFCTYTINQQGGGSDNGGGYSYYNTSKCADQVITAGSKVWVTYQIVQSGTHGPNVGILWGSVSLQTFPI